MPPPSHIVLLGPFKLDLKAGELQKNGRRIRLQEQPFRVLQMLVERPGEVVTREELQKRLWPNDTIVEFDHSINAAIKRLRDALGDTAEKPRYVETVARRGYRLLVPVERVEAVPAEPPVAAPVSPPPEGEPSPAGLIGKRVSHYRVLEIVGGGGMGVVYRAEDIKLGRGAALKFLPEELAAHPRALERFEREARAASALNHPHICTVYELGEHEGHPFIAMELLEGQTLGRLIAGKPLALDRLLDLAIQTADALDAAHQKGIIHRDIKPANLFVTNRGDVKVLDFGLAKLSEGVEVAPAGVERGNGDGVGGTRPLGAVIAPAGSTADSNITKTGVAMGTAPYMSPEQVRGERLDARTDLFSFGLVLYEMATGRVAFAGGSVAEVHEAIVNRTPAPARTLNPDIPLELDEIISKTLEKDRERRCQHAAEIRTDLEHLKRDALPGPAGRLQARLRRRWPLALAGLLALIAVAALVWFLTDRAPRPRPELTERQLTANPLEDYVMTAAISPDGRDIAYDDQTGLYIRSVASGETHAVSLPAGFGKTLGPGDGLAWFPDGENLLADVNNPGPYALWEIRVLGEAPLRLLYRNGILPAISPDGQLVAFTSCCEEGDPYLQEILVGGINGETPRKLVAAQAWGRTSLDENAVGSSAWSPDGRWIAYVRRWKAAQGSETSAIEVRRSTGGPAKTLVADANLPKPSSLCIASDPVESCIVAWSPDWRLVFAAGQAAEVPSAQAKYSLWQVGVQPGTAEAAGRPEQLTPWSDFGLKFLAITQDGKRLSLLKQRSWDDVYLAEFSPGGTSIKPPQRLSLDNRGIDGLDSWTRDSQAILFSSSRNGRAEVFRKGLNENIEEAILRGPEGYRDARLTADGAWMLYVEGAPITRGAPSTADRIMRRPVAGGSPEIVLQEPGGDTQGIGDPQGTYVWEYKCPLRPGPPCVLGEKNGNDLNFYSLDPVRGKGKQLGKAILRPFFGWDWDVSPDGSRLALIGLAGRDGRIEILNL